MFSWIDLIKNKTANLGYKIQTIYKKNIISNIEIKWENENEEIYLLGNLYKSNIEFNNKIIKDIIDDLKHFTYGYYFDNITDSGWGCTARSAQMLLYNIINNIENKNENFSQEKNKLMEDHFNFYSIINLISKDKINLNRHLSFEEVMNSLKQINEYKNLILLNFYIDNKIQIRDIKNYNNIEDNKNKLNNLDTIYEVEDVFLSINYLKKIYINWETLNILKQIFKIKYFCGLLGGENKRCYYIIAIKDEYIYFMDPHLILSKEDKKNGIWKINRIHYTKLQSSIMISFILNSNEFNQFIKELKNINNNLNKSSSYGDQFFEFLEEKDIANSMELSFMTNSFFVVD